MLRLSGGLSTLLLAMASSLAAQVPAELSSLASTSHLAGAVSGWCRATFRPGHPGAFAVAARLDSTGGRYKVLDSGTTILDLDAFLGKPELSCYSPAEARRLDNSIQHSEAIQGRIKPRWNGTVVCGFVAETHAVCWQYSPTAHVVVRVGEWVT